MHAWAFDLSSGAVAKPPESSACVSAYRVRVEDGIICVELPSNEPEIVPEPVSCERDCRVRYVVRKMSSPADMRAAQQ